MTIMILIIIGNVLRLVLCFEMPILGGGGRAGTPVLSYLDPKSLR
jgi:hypothetical protein